MMASMVGVFLKSSEGVVIVCASKASRLIASYLAKNDRHVVLVDTNRTNIEKAKELGLDAINANIYSDDLTDNIELNDVGYLLAMTGSDEINKQAINRYAEVLGENGSFRLMNSEELKVKDNLQSKRLFSKTHDYVKFTEVARDFPSIQEIEVDSESKFIKVLGYIQKEYNAIPLFLKDNEGHVSLIQNPTEMEVGDGYQVVYLGKPIDFEDIVDATRDEADVEAKNNL